ncbi:hypothetical protein [Actinomadura madurae]|uniref:hypothetical protein n=1 Tax=Actinomadura madurae TaxID=1993 RepID=UPI0020D25D7A|nr:hypothetical protein [Actinomadura madurae]MCP9953714.1 hypothetical protein [Actinomadura madurae]MCP9970470.1 hypothetical protein [Actinomadura madurae]MCP9982951.1 hypothetical protein [Actinomadura madurae]MCQ0019185.1 hypothetical protein [Actinomadura madurae]
MIEMFDERIVATGRLPLFGFFVAFIITFVLTRINVRLIRANVRWWFRNITAGDLHIHHVVFGVVLMLLGGVASLAVPDAYVGLDLVAAAVFGMGSALVLDEFALILHLSDVYWTEKGRASVDAVFVAIAVTGLLLLGIRPLGYEGIAPDPGTGVLTRVYVASLVVNLVFAVVTLLKGKIWTGLIGLFVPALLIVGAIRVARPGSPWSRWRYDPDSRKYQRAVRRERLFRRPLIRAKIWVQEFIAGRHDLIPPELLQRRAEAAERARRRRLARAERRAAARAGRRAAARAERRSGRRSGRRGARRAAPEGERGPLGGPLVRAQRTAGIWAERRSGARARSRTFSRTRRKAASRVRTRAVPRRRRPGPEEDAPPPGPPPEERAGPPAGTSGAVDEPGRASP